MRYFLLFAVLAFSAVSLAPGQLHAGPPERAPATIDVTLPADAQLTVDGQPTRSTSEHRLFITPALKAGKTFRYTFDAKFVRAGKTITIEQSVSIQAGRRTFVFLNLPGAVFADSSMPSGYSYTYGTGAETSSDYYGAESPALTRFGVTRPASAPTLVDFTGWPVTSGGFNEIHWGPNPSDPFYYNQE
jgi:uncharacterized protein (TIGR03000 family)